MRVLVIGGTNFLGLPLVRRLIAQGHEVAVLPLGAPPGSTYPKASSTSWATVTTSGCT